MRGTELLTGNTAGPGATEDLSQRWRCEALKLNPLGEVKYRIKLTGKYLQMAENRI